MTLDENTVRDALYSLQEKRMAGPARGADSRVTKYEHRTQEVFNFTRAENAVMDVLLLRGPQTPGELRGRSERLHRFEELSDVQATLLKLMQREPPFVKMLPRQPGTKEARYAHLLSGDVAGSEGTAESPAEAHHASSGNNDRLGALETEVVELRREVADLKQQVESFKKQFE
jgi:uncharacterized protein